MELFGIMGAEHVCKMPSAEASCILKLGRGVIYPRSCCKLGDTVHLKTLVSTNAVLSP